MNGNAVSVVQALSLAGSTFAIGISLGWILALLHISRCPDETDHQDEDE